MNESATTRISEDAKDAAKAATTQIREIFERFRLPGFDFDAWIEARQADIDAMSKATAIAYSGAQSISEKQAELLKSALGELNAAVKVRSSSETPGEKIKDITKQETELVQATLSRTLSGMKEMAEAVQKSQTEIYEIALDRARSNAEQLRALFQKDKEKE
jgi:phasin family protein